LPLFLLVLLQAAPGSAQERPVLRAARLTSPLRLDGRLDELLLKVKYGFRY